MSLRLLVVYLVLVDIQWYLRVLGSVWRCFTVFVVFNDLLHLMMIDASWRCLEVNTRARQCSVVFECF